MVGMPPLPNLFLTPRVAPPSPRSMQLSTALCLLFESGSVDLLRSRLDGLVQEAFRDPKAADEYSEREISKYVYLSHRSLRPEDRALLCRFDRGDIPLLDMVRAAYREDVALVRNYDGVSNPFERPDEFNVPVYGIRLLVGEEALKPALILGAEEILREMAIEGLPGNESPPEAFFRLHRGFPRLTERGERAEALQRILESSLLMNREGMTELVPLRERESQFEFPKADRTMHFVVAGLELFSASPNPFDKARLYHALPDLLAWFERYDSELARSGEVSPYPIHVDSLFGNALSAMAVFAGVESIGRILKSANASPRSLVGGPAAMETILRVKYTKEPIELSLSGLPTAVSDMARRIEIPGHGNLWSYLERNVDRVVFTDRLPDFNLDSMDSIDPRATVNRLLRKVIIKVGNFGEKDAAMTILWLLAHEAYHIASFYEASIGDPRLNQARILEERNAHLFTAMVLGEILKSGTKVFLPRLVHFRLMGLAVNLPLGYPLDDDSLRFDLPAGLGGDVLTHYPTRYQTAYLKKRGITHAMFAAEVKALL